MWGEQEDYTKVPDIENAKDQIESLLKDNDKEILINAVRIRIIKNRLSTEKKEELLAQLNNTLTRFLHDRDDLFTGREMLQDWRKDLK
jgi:uncharacterized protein (DUF2267 family)